MKKVTGILAAIAASFWATSALAAPLTLSDANVVGVVSLTEQFIDGNTTYTAGADGSVINGGPGKEIIAAQALLNLSQGAAIIDYNVGGISTNDYFTNTAYDFSGDLTFAIKQEVQKPAQAQTISGFEYIWAKYDGTQAGYVLFYSAGGAEITLPVSPENFWTQTGQYEISHWVAFNPKNSVPEPSAMLLIGTGIAGLINVGRKRRK